MNGLAILMMATRENIDIPIIMVSAAGDTSVAVQAMKSGAADYVVKELDGSYLDLLPTTVDQVVERRWLKREKEQAEAELLRQREILSAILANLDQGVCYFDASLHLIAWNQRYRDLLGYPENLLREAQTSLEDILRFNAARGEYGQDNLEEAVRNRLDRAGDPVPHRYERHGVGGMVLEVRGGPMPSGGFVTTYTDISERKAMEVELKRLATNDFLTNLVNRRRFLEQAEIELNRTRRFSTPLSLLMLDIDHFKQINDTWGHDVGDQVLRKVAQICRDTVRITDVCGRLGGEEFAILLPGTDLDGAAIFGERLRQFIEAAIIPLGDAVVTVTVSIGVGSLSGDTPSVETIQKKADERLYVAKNAGRNQVIAA
jgi:diguanylate cyclase (GGDEF)-like protein